MITFSWLDMLLAVLILVVATASLKTGFGCYIFTIL